MSNSSFISDWPIWRARPLLADAESEGGVVVEEERGDVVVVDEQQHVGTALPDPVLHRPEVFEDRCPGRVVLLVLVDGEADGGGVGGSDAADDLGHVVSLSGKCGSNVQRVAGR
jgi:hypothetical protein